MPEQFYGIPAKSIALVPAAQAISATNLEKYIGKIIVIMQVYRGTF